MLSALERGHSVITSARGQTPDNLPEAVTRLPSVTLVSPDQVKAQSQAEGMVSKWDTFPAPGL